ncbi:hypothetical protein [Rufibacter immobilis]|uniref:hypothetical protein n=1 Tax=Rufibacter immobilis TaxID=1348778 RepID=UPI0011CDC24B|nr:hypothetical protein [Rufibacter immobilis]
MTSQLPDKHKVLARFLSLAFLLVLTLFSSCSIRKAVQETLDVAAVSTLNVAKATVQSSDHCPGAPDQATVSSLNHQHDHQQALVPPFLSLPTRQFLRLSGKRPILASSDGPSASSVPLYLMYKKLKLLA